MLCSLLISQTPSDESAFAFYNDGGCSGLPNQRRAEGSMAYHPTLVAKVKMQKHEKW
jgi:hypothetical protein